LINGNIYNEKPTTKLLNENVSPMDKNEFWSHFKKGRIGFENEFQTNEKINFENKLLGG
jgi:hypothetical protein